MHIFLLASFGPSLLNFRGHLIRDLISEGYKVSVGAPQIDNQTRQRLIALGATPYDTPLKRNVTGIRADLAYLRGLKRLWRGLRPDVVLTSTIKPNVWGAFAAAQLNIQSISMVTGLGYAFSEEKSGLKTQLTRVLARRLYRAATEQNKRVIFQNPDDRDDFIDWGCLGNKTKARLVNGSGVDLNYFHRAPLVQAPVFLMIARLLVSKGVEEYIEAARLVRQQYPQARFTLIGPDDGGPDAIDPSVITRGVNAGYISWPGSTDDVRQALRDTAVYVLPSYREGTPRSVLEAMAMGRPIVTTDAPGCRETVIDGRNGFLVPVRDGAALAEALKKFIKNPSLIQKMGDQSYKIAKYKYNVEKVNAEMLEIIESL